MTPDTTSALTYGWRKFRDNVAPMLLVVLVPVAVQAVLSLVLRPVASGYAGLALANVIGVILSVAASLGIYRVALMTTAGEAADVAKAYRYDRWAEWLLFSVVYGAILGVGLMVLVVPGLLFLAFWGLAPYYFLDARLSVGDALRASRDAVRRKGLAFPILASIVVGALGVILCIVGVIVTQAVAYVAVAFLYRYAADQAVAD